MKTFTFCLSLAFVFAMKTFTFCLSLAFVFGMLKVTMAQEPDFTGIKVMINPGHGGHDSDDRGMPNGFWESESNLTKGLWLRDLLEERGCEVVMSRLTNFTADDLPLSQIAAMANENDVDLFLSIHSNAGNQTSNYPMPIFNGKSETPTNPKAKEYSIILWEQLIQNEATFWTYTQPKYVGDLTLNPSWTTGYGVLYPLAVPGIISEGSFHDYAPEVARLLNLDYRKQEAMNFLYSMVTYFQLAGKVQSGQISGIVRDSLLPNPNYTISNSPDKYNVVQNTVVELVETGEVYEVGNEKNAQYYFNDPNKVFNFNAGFYGFDSLPAGEYTLVFKAPKYYNDTVKVKVESHSFTYHNHWMRADHSIAPKIISAKPTDGATIHCNDALSFTFSMEMDSASVAQALVVSPEVSGTFSWDEKHLTGIFQPDIPYETNTQYQVSMTINAKQKWGVALENEFGLRFSTDNRNRYELLKVFPEANQENVSTLLQFRAVFDAPLLNSSLINAAWISDSEGNIIHSTRAKISSIDGQGHYYFNAETELKNDTKYFLYLAGSIKDQNNIPLVDTVIVPFTTGAAIPEQIIIQEMDAATEWSIDYTASKGIDTKTFLYQWKSDFLSGKASLLTRYQFLGSDGFVLIKPKSTISLLDKSKEIGLWVNGDLSGNALVFGFNNEATTDAELINFAGWWFIISQIPEGATELSYIKLVQNSEAAVGGDILFDALSQPKGVSVTSNEAELILTVYPNPIDGNILYVNGLHEQHCTYRMLNMEGKVIQSGLLENSIIHLGEATLSNRMIIIEILSQSGVFHEIIINN